MVKPDVIVGIIGNVVSILSFASSVGTFKEIVAKKSAENYKGVPYIMTLVSTSMWTFYGTLDPDGVLVITVNVVGMTFQVVYIILFLTYSSKEGKIKYFGFVVLDLTFIGMVVATTLAAFHGGTRRTFIGVLCATFTIGMYVAPLAAVRRVIRTRSVKYMPFLLSLSLFANAAAWFTFALLLKDYYILVPNGVGIFLGSLQLTIYFIYKNKKPLPKELDTLEDDVEQITEESKNVAKMEHLEEGKIVTVS